MKNYIFLGASTVKISKHIQRKSITYFYRKGILLMIKLCHIESFVRFYFFLSNHWFVGLSLDKIRTNLVQFIHLRWFQKILINVKNAGNALSTFRDIALLRILKIDWLSAYA